MTYSDPLALALEELRGIEWREDLYRRSHVLLLQEFLRRTALWATALASADDWPLFDIARRIAPTLQFSEEVLDEIIRSKPLFNPSRHSLARVVCLWHLNWANLCRDSFESVEPFDLPSPYEPLTLMFSRGGTALQVHKGDLTMGTISASIRTIAPTHLAPEPVCLLDEATLNKFD